ncbi:MAG: hypothetical protein HYV37_03195 [Candidatus Levyibacteriota bacterium]|nr:MAG: hypothetical protein HYV37_03195 [Candidatus Levybacteria bacterium]
MDCIIRFFILYFIQSEQKPGQQDYKREYEYHHDMLDHSREFDKLVDSVPEDNTKTREAIRGMFYSRPDKLIDPVKF